MVVNVVFTSSAFELKSKNNKTVGNNFIALIELLENMINLNSLKLMIYDCLLIQT